MNRTVLAHLEENLAALRALRTKLNFREARESVGGVVAQSRPTVSWESRALAVTKDPSDEGMLDPVDNAGSVQSIGSRTPLAQLACWGNQPQSEAT